jgi:hypothetical protein
VKNFYESSREEQWVIYQTDATFLGAKDRLIAAALTMSLLAKSKIFSVCYKSLSEQQFKKLTGVDQAAWSTCMDLESKKFLRIYQQEFRRAISRQLDFAARAL